ncbi:MAG: Ohr subfamily peroxiredoxin [Zunongwangia sp.]|jgi:Ohr subfamily peroxiredoxin|uniref:Ohr subfamily peroxiredoxin n=1 Tax=Zunongwangia profunda TaxID=398743 RepID=A0A3D5J0C0_9FLAO|nr:organic hydroperoxide resistance protein [Zunongwangia profunda]MAG88083.1 Ohr subfamily peroxiredoxin [Flavobacteriaceae bacterium]MAO35642.1 Ohr subfamily peroxiredoxin [Zunongwangia sp.]MAS69590.1 Ohr subfamily peroxiredoxin [Zunongwangia sp.]MCC4230138.1 organic hydroperoxide resistance protein [Zunongwangia profunda]HCV81561.1 Ohr subfamily peroxiredoxin [Zunongwangia profunda]|tara:strand:- start:649 stop:1077 length:429 start_codon:yes stop_codon:yes gene_type:complete
MKTLYSAKVTTEGGRKGRTISDDGILDLQLSMPKSLGGEGGDYTNPEQLFAAGYSACFGSALEMVAKNANVDLGDYNVTVTIDLGQNEDEELDLSAILDIYIPDIDVETGEDLINEAHEVCPYSRATRDNIDVTLNLLIDED